MTTTRSLPLLLLLASLFCVSFARQGNPRAVCKKIAQVISTASAVFYPNDPEYVNDNKHWAVSSSQDSTCSFEPGTAHDLGKALRFIGREKVQFGVKSGGHATNPGFSSTSGVQIALTRFNIVTYHQETQTADIGTGLVFDDVYKKLERHNVAVLGGRVSGIGVGGFLLGGGYSWHTNQYGLAIDSIIEFEVVSPSGDVIIINDKSNPKLFFGLKGGFNNFGIVTRITMKTFPQGAVWGGTILYEPKYIQDVTAAFLKFTLKVTDPKASIITTFNNFLQQPVITQLFFYDGSCPPDGIFDDFLDIPSISNDVSERSFLSLVQSFPANELPDARGVFDTVPLATFTPGLLNTIFNECLNVGKAIGASSGILASYSSEPFLPNILSHNCSPSAYPPTRSQAFLPFNVYIAWKDKAFDDNIFKLIHESTTRIRESAINEGQSNIVDAPLYPNYAIFGTPLEKMYGDNVEVLEELKTRMDPKQVMNLCGGFKFI
ncbi:hypothetical protein AMATHDRAFT_69520 [Amanita thiersii Skay4041]|uniref:FAD-binding PCMH-type domain-containing protein n=1 Tax=Amanita thiersii Skay4041 TaxID=703135 RepID=A0A2A9NFP5_9AGAR|nr:hypothetical protein AMATHDRAFT_69520 [Amanita thiersii Skay4041]